MLLPQPTAQQLMLTRQRLCQRPPAAQDQAFRQCWLRPSSWDQRPQRLRRRQTFKPSSTSLLPLSRYGTWQL